MSIPTNPFLSTKPVQAGQGKIHIANLPSNFDSHAGPPRSSLKTLEYQYPLKLVAPDPISIPYNPPSGPERDTNTQSNTGAAFSPTEATILSTAKTDEISIHTIFLLSYGGGLISGDSINLTIHLDPAVRLNLLTQGSTKIFKTRPRTTQSPTSSVQSPSPHNEGDGNDFPMTRQSLTTHISENATLIYLPDPTQPFAASKFTQTQTYILSSPYSNLLALDWVTSGRPARDEVWKLAYYASNNEVYASLAASSSRSAMAEGVGHEKEKRLSREGKGRLLVRDNIILDAHDRAAQELNIGVGTRVWDAAVFGTLLIHGPLFASLSRFFIDEFSMLPRIGAPKLFRQFAEDEEPVASETEGEKRRKEWRKQRWKHEQEGKLLWTASNMRGAFCVVKFSAGSVEAAREWVRGILEEEGSVREVVGERGIMCLR